MRPYRMGTSSCTRVTAWLSRRVTGSGRDESASQAPCVERGTSARAALPRAARSSAVRCSSGGASTSGPAVDVD